MQVVNVPLCIMDISAAVTVFYTGENTLLNIIGGSTTVAIVDITFWAVTEDTAGLMAPGHQVLQPVCEVSSINHELILIMLYGNQCLPILFLYFM